MIASFKSSLVVFFACEDGATAIEYGIIASLISVSAMVAIYTIGTETSNNIFGVVSGTLR